MYSGKTVLTRASSCGPGCALSGFSVQGGQVFQDITNEITAAAGEVHDRKKLAGTNMLIEQSLAEVGLLAAYSRTVNINDFKQSGRQLNLLPTDIAGRRIRVLIPRYWPVRVYSNCLDEDVIVVAEVKARVRLIGWLPMDQVEEAPVYWFQRDGKRTGYSHEIDQPYLIQMPTEFDFVDTCKHGDEWPALWDYSGRNGWFCFGCERVLYAENDRRKLREQDRRLGFGNQIPEA